MPQSSVKLCHYQQCNCVTTKSTAVSRPTIQMCHNQQHRCNNQEHNCVTIKSTNSCHNQQYSCATTNRTVVSQPIIQMHCNQLYSYHTQQCRCVNSARVSQPTAQLCNNHSTAVSQLKVQLCRNQQCSCAKFISAAVSQLTILLRHKPAMHLCYSKQYSCVANSRSMSQS